MKTNALSLLGGIQLNPAISFEETARRLAIPLNVSWKEDVSGKYEEQRAFVAETGGFVFELLTDWDRSRKRPHVLQIGPAFDPPFGCTIVDISEYYIRFLSAAGLDVLLAEEKQE